MAPRKRAASAAAVDYGKMTVAQLKAACKKAGLDETGRKKDLIDRLETGSAPPPKLQRQSTIEKAVDQMLASAAGTPKKKKPHKVDKVAEQQIGGNVQVYKDYDCMLNQTNIGHNNNKYYVIQTLTSGKTYFTFTRWGRVGEPGQNQVFGPFNKPEDAIKQFEKKFNDKTCNKWTNRGKFNAVPKKYTLIDVEGGSDDEDTEVKLTATTKGAKVAAKMSSKSSLDPATQDLVKLIFDNDMFNNALINLEIDVKKMPLGKLSKTQIVKGFQALDAIDKALKSRASASQLAQLSSQFYTVIPHNFGRRVPPVISSQDDLRQKLDMLITLGDIEMTQNLMKQEAKDSSGPVAHPLDQNYQKLKCGLTLLKPGDKEFKIIEEYFNNTKRRSKKVLHMWKVDREGENNRFNQHNSVPNRRLLWHGTNVAVVAAILKAGLRIMPHSGGRVGKGIYLASESSKSECYMSPSNKNIGIIFLNEAVLGNEHTTLTGGWQITAPPSGFHSIVARGQKEPDPKRDTKLKIDGHDVYVPQGKPISQKQWASSQFDQSEYLVYKESQVRIRYVLMLQM